jgi:hypothetical protein
MGTPLAVTTIPKISPGSRSIRKDGTEKSASASGIKKRREKVEHSLTSSDHDSGGTTSSKEDAPEGSHPGMGPSVPGLREFVPSRSDHRYLVSYRTYKPKNRSPSYDKIVTAKLSSHFKANQACRGR